MDFELSDEQRLLVDSARAFASRERAPHAADRDRDHDFPVDVIQQAAEQGYLALYIKEDDGGLGLSQLSAALIFEQLAAGSPVARSARPRRRWNNRCATWSNANSSANR